MNAADRKRDWMLSQSLIVAFVLMGVLLNDYSNA